jgi:hypothetical protein
LRWELDVMHADKGRSTYAAWPDSNNDNSDTIETAPVGKILKTQSTEVSRE